MSLAAAADSTSRLTPRSAQVFQSAFSFTRTAGSVAQVRVSAQCIHAPPISASRSANTLLMLSRISSSAAPAVAAWGKLESQEMLVPDVARPARPASRTVTSWPSAASRNAMFAPTAPAPTITTRTGLLRIAGSRDPRPPPARAGPCVRFG